MKKKIILIIILLLLTGCKVEYKINLNNDLSLEESITLLAITDDDINKLNNFNLNIPINKRIDDYNYFETRIENIDYYNSMKGNNKITFDYNYNKAKYSDYADSTFANMAYEYISINKVDKTKLVLSTSKEFNLFNNYDNLEEVKVTFNTNYKVLSNNADKVKKHNYTWVITKDNAYGKSIYLKIDTAIEDLTFFEKLIRGDYFNIFTISLLILVIGYVIYTFLKKKSDNRDKI